MRSFQPSRRSTRLLELLLAASLALSAAACGTEETTETAGETATIVIEESEAPPAEAVPSDELPAPGQLPADIPTFPGSEPASELAAYQGYGMMMLSSDQPAEEVYAFYSRELPGQGWTLEEQADTGRILGSKGERTVNLMIRDVDGSTEISLVFRDDS